MGIKAGWKTTEFWVTVLSTAGWVAAAGSGALPAKWAAILTAVSTVAYKLSRGLAKNGAAATGAK